MKNALPPLAGISFKPEHFEEAIASKVGFFEVHAENYMGKGGMLHAQLRALCESFPLSLHGVALSLGGAQPLDRAHLSRLKLLLARYNFVSFSEHLAWSTHDDIYFNDLLPLPYNAQSLLHVCNHIDETQSFLGCQMLLENPSTYLTFNTSDMSETDFLKAIVKRTGCGLLLDVNNVYVSSRNQQLSPFAYLDEFPLNSVGEIHLGGHAQDEASPLLIDAHDRAVAPSVWDLYGYVLGKTGAKPTLVEWDNDVPSFAVLDAERIKAQEVLSHRVLAHA